MEVGTEDIEGMEITEVSLLSDFPEPDSLEAEIFNNLIGDILKEETIQKEVEACVKDLIDSVEENVKSLEKKILHRKRPISKANWKITKRRKAHESGQEYTNYKGKLIASKTVKFKKDCMNSCKFNCAQQKGISRIDFYSVLEIGLEWKTFFYCTNIYLFFSFWA